MNKFKSVACCMVLLLAGGCAGIYQSLMEDSMVVLAYGEELGVKDQAQVATLFINKDYGLWLNGQEIKATGGKVNPALRVSQNLAGNATTMIDILPGVYRVAIMGSISESGGGRTYTTRTPAEAVYSFLPGKVYSIELYVVYPSGSVLIREMPAELTATAVNNRAKAVF